SAAPSPRRRSSSFSPRRSPAAATKSASRSSTRWRVSSKLDAKFMHQALRLAERARGHTRPNPPVGAVIVRGGRALATGFTHRPGEAHAEADALAKLGGRARGATVYVTLEPCNHVGRPGPCSH